MTITFSAPALYFGFLVSLVAFSGTIKGLPKVKAGGATKPRSSPFAKWRDSNPAGDKTRVDIIMFGAKLKRNLTFFFFIGVGVGMSQSLHRIVFFDRNNFFAHQALFVVP